MDSGQLEHFFLGTVDVGLFQFPGQSHTFNITIQKFLVNTRKFCYIPKHEDNIQTPYHIYLYGLLVRTVPRHVIRQDHNRPVRMEFG
jgi:hypothetical protein